MKSICFFISYTKDGHRQDMPMIQDLIGQFDELVIVTNEKTSIAGAEVLVMSNLGYDFGFLYRAIAQKDLSGYDTLVFINNSNVLVKGRSLSGFFEWGRLNGSNFYGITDSYEAPPGIERSKSYHIQSHLLVFKSHAIGLLKKFFSEIRFDRFFSIKDQVKLRQSIINDCEVGLTQYMMRNGERPIAMYPAKTMTGKYRRQININTHVHLWEELITEGYPLMKKKIVNGEWKPLLKNINNKHKYTR